MSTAETGAPLAPEPEGDDTDAVELTEAEAEIATLRAALEELEADLVRHRRLLAQRVEDRARERVVALVREILPALDTLTYARRHGGDLDATSASALEDALVGVLTRHGVTIVGEPGEPFDPALHEALDAPDIPVGAYVVEVVLRPGYRLDGQLVRPATVALRVA